MRQMKAVQARRIVSAHVPKESSRLLLPKSCLCLHSLICLWQQRLAKKQSKIEDARKLAAEQMAKREAEIVQAAAKRKADKVETERKERERRIALDKAMKQRISVVAEPVPMEALKVPTAKVRHVCLVTTLLLIFSVRKRAYFVILRKQSDGRLYTRSCLHILQSSLLLRCVTCECFGETCGLFSRHVHAEQEHARCLLVWYAALW